MLNIPPLKRWVHARFGFTHIFLVLLQLRAEALHSELGGFQFLSDGRRDTVLLQRGLLRILQL